MDVKTVAKEMLKLFDGKPERWTQGAFVRIKVGRKLFVGDKSLVGHRRAVCWCLEGALSRVTAGWSPLYDKMSQELNRRIPGHHYLTWSDAPERTFADIEALLRSIAEGA